MFIAELYGSWEGRIGRLMHVGALVALTLVYELLLLLTGHPIATGEVGVVQGILALIVIYPSWVVSVKRAHDLGSVSKKPNQGTEPERSVATAAPSGYKFLFPKYPFL